jgi:hypothetical protein
MCKQNPLKHFRTLEGNERRAAMRAHLSSVEGIDFTADPHALKISQQCALADMAKAVAWRKSPTSPLSLGLAFFVYLGRSAPKPGHVEPQRTGKPAQRRPAFVFGAGHA